MSRISTLVLSVLVITTAARAQPLADRVPADALFYVGWSGSENIGSTYEASRLKAVLDASDVRKLFTESMPALAERAGRDDPKAREVISFLSAVGERAWRHPTAVYVGPFDFADPRNPKPRVVLLCDAAAESTALRQQIQTAIDRAGKMDVPMKVTAEGNLVIVTIGQNVGIVAKDKSLSADAAFQAALGQVHKQPVAAAYLNIAGIVKMIDEAPPRGRKQQQNHENWIKARDALGLASAKSLIWTGAFDGKDWSGKVFLAAPVPRSGIFTMLDQAQTVSDDTLKLVPQSATMCVAGTFDPARLLEGIRTAAAKVDPTSTQKINEGLDRFRTMTGLDLQKDVLEPFGDQWVAFSSPDIAGNYSFCMALANRLDDPAKAETSLVQLGRSITNMATAAMAQSNMILTIRETTDGDLKIHYLATPILRPSWAIKNGVLYVGLFPQVVSAAARQTGGKSILDNDAFVALRKRLGDQKPTGIKFVDLPRTAATVYPTWMFLTGYAGFGDLFGVPTPSMLLPPLDKLTAQLAPAGSIAYVDDAGWHSTGLAPFPGSTALGSDPTISAVPPLLVSILLPSLNRARETANRVKCASNERQIAQGMLLYSNENKGNYPPDLGTILKTQDITIEVFVCPSSADTIPAAIRTAPIEEQVKWVNENSSYTYLGGGLKNDTPADRVILYEKSDDHDEDGMNILYGDGHVEWQAMPMAQELIKNAGKKN